MKMMVVVRMMMKMRIKMMQMAMVPSGKRLHNYGRSPFLIGKSTISMGHVQ